MDREQARLKREERKVKAKKEREKRRREEEKKQQMELEFQELGECRLFAPWWGKLMKIGLVIFFSFPGLYILFLPGIDFTSRLPGLLYLLFFVPSYVKDIRQLLFPVADVVINGKGILVQSFWTSPGQIAWENLDKIRAAYVIESAGWVGLLVDGFDVKFKNKKAITEKKGFLSGIYYKLRLAELFQLSSISVPSGLDIDKLRVAANYFYGEWEKKQRVEKLESPKQTAEQKRKEHSKQVPKK